MRTAFALIAVATIILAGTGVCQDAGDGQPAAETDEVAQRTEEPANPLRLVLPPDIYAVPGHEVSIYFDNIVLTPNIKNYIFDVTCNRGRQDEDRWRYTASEEDLGQFSLSIKVMDPAMNVLGEADTMIHVTAADAGAGEQISLITVGDSLTNAAYYPGEIYTLFQAEGNPQLAMVGTNKCRVEGALHQGYGGWRWETFCTRWTDGDDYRARSPFLRLEGDTPMLDFQNYLDQYNNGEAPDFITVLLGCNDTFGATEALNDDGVPGIEAAIDTMMHYADILIEEFRKVGPETQIGICLLPPPATSQDAFGTNYKCGQTRWQYRRNVQRVVERELEKWAGREDENIFIIPLNVNVDCANGYPARAEPINARTENTVVRQINGVHPAPSGYYQMADSIYYWMKYRLAQ
jgi:hypothetical protein